MRHRREDDQGTWMAFTALAPYAYDASARDQRGRAIVSLSDVGTSASFALTTARAERAATLLAPWQLVPLATVRDDDRARRRTTRRARPRRWTRLLHRRPS